MLFNLFSGLHKKHYL